MRALSRAAIPFLFFFSAPLHAASPIVSGVVMNEAGAPLAGAEILTVPAGVRYPRETRTRADAAGRFQLTPQDCHPSYLKVSARGFAPALLTVSPCNGSPDYRLVLTPGATASGTILDADGRPVAGIGVELVRSEARLGTWLGFQDPGPYRATTGPGGRFAVTDLPPGGFTLVAAHPEHPRLQQAGIDVAEGERKVALGRFTLRKAVPMGGQVVDPQGQPVAGVRVIPYVYDAVSREMAPTTGPDGRFTLPEQVYGRLFFCKPGYLPGQSSALRPSQISRIVLTPEPPPFRLSGRVLDPEGRPKADAQVRISEPPVPIRADPRPQVRCGFQIEPSPCSIDAPPPAEPTAVSDADGRFSMEIERPGSLALEAVAPGYLRALPVEVAVARGGSATVDFKLRPATVVTGRVFHRDGSPAVGARISPARLLNGPEAFTDSQGRYRLEGLEPGRRDLRAEHPELGLALRRLGVSAGENALDFTLDPLPERTVSGRVLGPDGEPLAGAEIGVPGSPLYSAADGGFRAVLPRDQELRETETIYVRLKAYAPVELPFRPADAPLKGVEIRLRREQNGPDAGREPLAGPVDDPPPSEEERDLTGRVLDWPEGASARIDASRGDVNRWADVGPDGTWRLERLGPGDWTLRIWVREEDDSQRQGEARVQLRPGQAAAHVDFDLSFGQETLTGHLTRGGQPVRAWITLLSPTGGDELSSRFYGADEDDDSPFRFDNLRPGRYVLKILDQDYGRVSRVAVEVSGGEEIRIDLKEGQP